MSRHQAEKRRTDRLERLEFGLIYAVVFMLFFVVAVAKRLLPWRGQAVSRTLADRRGVIGEAKSAASASVPFAFMV